MKSNKKTRKRKSSNDKIFIIFTLIFLLLSLIIVAYKVANPLSRITQTDTKAAPPAIISGQPSNAVYPTSKVSPIHAN